jgi:hypothetical protein
MLNNNHFDPDELRNFLSPEEFKKLLPDEILDQLKCPHCGGYLVAQFYDEYGKFYKIYTPNYENNTTTCGYCKKIISDGEIERQVKAISSK